MCQKHTKRFFKIRKIFKVLGYHSNGAKSVRSKHRSMVTVLSHPLINLFREPRHLADYNICRDSVSAACASDTAAFLYFSLVKINSYTEKGGAGFIMTQSIELLLPNEE